MGRGLHIGLLAGLFCAACAPGEISSSSRDIRAAPPAVFLSADSDFLDADLLRVRVEVEGVDGPRLLDRYAQCVAAGRAVAEGLGFARHVRTNSALEGGIWRADAVYTMSAALPPGLQTLDAEVIAQNCVESGIPTR